MRKASAMIFIVCLHLLNAQEVLHQKYMRNASTTIIVRNSLYRIGGHLLSGPYAIQRYFLNPQTGLPTGVARNCSDIRPGMGLFQPSAAATEHYLYIPSGVLQDNQGKLFPLPGTLRFRIELDGSLTGKTFLKETPEPANHGAAVMISGKYLLIIGGYNSRNCYAAKILSDGSLTEWQTLRPLPTNALSRNMTARIGKRIFVSGIPGHNIKTDKIFSTELDEEGLPGRWRRIGALPVPTDNTQILAADASALLYFDGKTGKIHRAAVSAEGDIGAWQLLPETLPQAPFLSFHLEKMPKNQWLLMNALTLVMPRKFIPGTLFTIKEPAQ